MTIDIPRIVPNWHAILIHFPLALLSLGMFIEILSPFWRHGAFRKAGRWMLLLGTLLAIPAVTTGLYAMKSVVGGHGGWHQRVGESTLTADQWTMLIRHLWWSVAGVGCFIVAVILWLGGSDAFRRRLHWPLLIVAVAGIVCLISGGWHGGEMVYGQAVAVANVSSKSTSTTSATGGVAATAPAIQSAPAASGDKLLPGITLATPIRQTIQPLQLHLLLAGLTFALAAVALGLSFRALAEYRQGVSASADPYSGLSQDERIIDALRGDEMTRMNPLAYPPARFWILALILALGTAAAGLWSERMWDWARAQSVLERHRALAHALGGSAIIVLSLLLAIATRFARRRGWLLGVLSLLLILAVAAQIWLGVLITFDSSKGPVWRITPSMISPTPHPTA